MSWRVPSGRGWDVGELIEEFVEGSLAVVDRSTFVVGEGMLASMRCGLSFASSNSALEESFGAEKSHFAQAIRCWH